MNSAEKIRTKLANEKNDTRVLKAVLGMLRCSRDILQADKSPGNVAIRGQIFATIRAAETESCRQMSWPRIATVCGYRNHTTVMLAAKRWEKKHGAVKPWRMH